MKAARTESAENLNEQGLRLHAAGRFDRALRNYDKALSIAPDYPEILNNRGITLQALQRFDEAIACYDCALKIRPDFAEARNNRGVALYLLNRLDEALAEYGRALAIRPIWADASHNRGLALHALQRFDEAVAGYDAALALRGDWADALHNRATALQALQRFDEALKSYDAALALRPDWADAWHNRGTVLHALERFDDAIASYDRALAIKPDHKDAIRNLASACTEARRFDEALAHYDRLFALGATGELGRWYKSSVLLHLGRFAEGWGAYEAYRKENPRITRNLDRPEWDGRTAHGKRLWFYADHGLGDTIQFCRFAQSVAAQGADVVLEVQPPLKALMASLDGVTVIGSGEVPALFDAHLPLMSLPLALGTTIATIPARVPYLRADPGRIEHWARRLPEAPLRIGIAWQGNPNPVIDSGRSFHASFFAPLAAIPGVKLISLQKNTGAEQLGALPADMRVEVLDDVDAGPDAFVDTAAIMMSLDLIITGDTAMAHLAGALGRPVWVVLKYTPDWRWMLDRDDSPWYPTARLFRQKRRGDWREVFERIAAEVRRLVEPKSGERMTREEDADARSRGQEPEQGQPLPGCALVPVPFGDLIDRIAILEIKCERVGDVQKVAAIREELTHIEAAARRFDGLLQSASGLVAELRTINKSLWDMEDQMRAAEKSGDFGPAFVALARSISKTNDRRAAIKQKLNVLAGARFVGEKYYGGAPRGTV